MTPPSPGTPPALGTFSENRPRQPTLTGANRLSGGYVLQSGILSLGSTGALGSSGFLSFDGGTLQYTASNTTSYADRFSNQPSQQYRLDTNGQNITQIAGLHSTTGSLTKLGAGTLTISADNTYTGATSVLGGTLASPATRLPRDLPSASGATLELRPASADYGSSTTFSGSGTLRKTGAGDARWTTAAATFRDGFRQPHRRASRHVCRRRQWQRSLDA